MKSHVLPSILRRWPLAAPLLAVFLFSSPASALLMRDNGPEPIIIQIKESLRLSDNLDTSLNKLAQLQREAGVNVEKWCAGRKLLQLVSFPKDFTEEKALAVIKTLQQSDAVEKVVAVSASNLEFKPADFAREYGSSQAIPEAARRGLDRDELSHSAMTQAQIDEAARMPHVPNQLIVRWKSRYVWKADATGFLQDIESFHAAAGARVINEMRPSPTDLSQVIEIDNLVTPFADKLRRYVDCPWVDYAQPNYIYSGSSVLSDPFYTNPGQPDMPKISAPSAWMLTTGNHDWVVAVADSGANIYHPDFAPNLSPGWYNFVSDNTDVTDEFGHGSNVAGIIGAKGNNTLYMTGTTQNVSLLHLKVLNYQGVGTTYNAARAIDYAYTSDQGHAAAIAINLSFAIPELSSTLDPTLLFAVRRAQGHNLVVVSSAGNNDADCELPNSLSSPGCIPTDNLISVGATNLDDTRARWGFYFYGSNYGRYRIELGAPGTHILGLTQDPNANPAYSYFDGTSQAAPHVAGAVELVKSYYPWEDYAGLRDRVIMGTDDVAVLNGVFRTGGRLNLAKALQKRTLIRNFSTRAKVESGDRIVIGGFTIGGTGSGTLKVAIRGLGPSLPALSVPRLNDPKLQLNNSAGQPIFLNDDWIYLPQSQRDDLAASGLTPLNSHEAAIVQTLAPGSYTVFLQSQDGQQGVGLFEIWELSGNTNEQTRLRSISTRCPVGVGDEVPIAGTITGDPNGSQNVPKRRLLIRGKGPSLTKLGVPGALADPKIELHNSSGGLIDSNDQWRDVDGTSTGLEDKLTESGFAPTDESESVLWPTLVKGTYTTILQGVNNGTGIGLIEFYEY